MATVVMMRNPQTGVVKKGFLGFSWTTLFFGGFPAMFRGDWLIGAILVILNLVTFGFTGLIAAFIYNKTYTMKLLENGYQFADTEALNALARAKLNVSMVQTASTAT